MSEIYLGSRYSRLDELNGYARELRADGHTVSARWLTGEHGTLVGHTSRAEGDAFARLCAEHDRDDLGRADAVVIFTDPPDFKSPRGRGGVHVEFGMALALRKRVLVVGHRVHVFHHLPEVEFYLTWPEARTALNGGGSRP